MNDNKNPNDNVLALPEPQPGPSAVLVPDGSYGITIIGYKNDGTLFINSEHDAPAEIVVDLELAKAKVLSALSPLPDDDDQEPPAA